MNTVRITEVKRRQTDNSSQGQKRDGKEKCRGGSFSGVTNKRKKELIKYDTDITHDSLHTF